jgi:GTP-binding protein Era
MHTAGFKHCRKPENHNFFQSIDGREAGNCDPKSTNNTSQDFRIYNEEDLQIVFSDTPLDPKYNLQEKMMDFVKDSLQDADVFLFIVDVTDKEEPSEFLIDKLNKIPVPVLLLLNKVDQTNQEGLEKLVDEWHNRIPKAEILPISVLMPLIQILFFRN